ncbi:unnamed protein product [Blepharisma stoltei]|uniref:Uncharacterized protein n=1 Tax=Blepharisma stoltei TaxID=1481888 RepID=A0AAU9J098_9CILI|nr:unnamed protein product [Blepharisma stoltei]
MKFHKSATTKDDPQIFRLTSLNSINRIEKSSTDKIRSLQSSPNLNSKPVSPRSSRGYLSPISEPSTSPSSRLQSSPRIAEIIANIKLRAETDLKRSFATKSPKLSQCLKRLEKSRYGREIVSCLDDRVYIKKKKYDSIMSKKSKLIRELEQLEEEFASIKESINESGKSSSLSKLEEKYQKLIENIHNEKKNRDVLNHMFDVRRDSLTSLKDRALKLEKDVSKAKSLEVLLDRKNSTQLQFLSKDETHLLREESLLNSQKNELRKKLNSELKEFEGRETLISFYKISQKNWYDRWERQILEKKIGKIGASKQESSLSEENYMSELERDFNLNVENLQSIKNETGSGSLSELSHKLAKQKETKQNLINLQTELQDTLRKQQIEICELRRIYEDFSHKNCFNDSNLNKRRFEIEQQIIHSEMVLEGKMSKLKKMSEDCAKVISALNSIVSKFSRFNRDSYKLSSFPTKTMIQIICNYISG